MKDRILRSSERWVRKDDGDYSTGRALRVRHKCRSLRIPERTGTAEFTRLGLRVQGIFVGSDVGAPQMPLASVIKMRGGRGGYEDREKIKLWKEAAQQHRFGDAADGEYIGRGARMSAVLAHGHVHIIEGAAHHEL